MQPQRYGPFPYVPINRWPLITWPDSACVALRVIPNIRTQAELVRLKEQEGDPRHCKVRRDN